MQTVSLGDVTFTKYIQFIARHWKGFIEEVDDYFYIVISIFHLYKGNMTDWGSLDGLRPIARPIWCRDAIRRRSAQFHLEVVISVGC